MDKLFQDLNRSRGMRLQLLIMVGIVLSLSLSFTLSAQTLSKEEARLQRLERWNKAVEHVRYVRRGVNFPQARATMVVPAHFKYVDLVYLRYLLQSQGQKPEPEVLGWLVHETVDLKQPDWWYVQISWHNVGHTNARSLAGASEKRLLARARVVRNALNTPGNEKVTLLNYAQAPYWDGNALTVQWSERLSFPETRETLIDCKAVKPGREGYLKLEISFARESREELCFRTTRLVLGGTQFSPGSGYYDYRSSKHKTAAFDLGAVVTGEAR